MRTQELVWSESVHAALHQESSKPRERESKGPAPHTRQPVGPQIHESKGFFPSCLQALGRRQISGHYFHPGHPVPPQPITSSSPPLGSPSLNYYFCVLSSHERHISVTLTRCSAFSQLHDLALALAFRVRAGDPVLHGHETQKPQTTRPAVGCLRLRGEKNHGLPGFRTVLSGRGAGDGIWPPRQDTKIGRMTTVTPP